MKSYRDWLIYGYSKRGGAVQPQRQLGEQYMHQWSNMANNVVCEDIHYSFGTMPSTIRF